jgi:hypothetical protein
MSELNAYWQAQLDQLRKAYHACIEFVEERLEIDQATKVIDTFNAGLIPYMMSPPDDMEYLKNLGTEKTESSAHRSRRANRIERTPILLIDHLKPTRSNVEFGRLYLGKMYEKLREYVPTKELAQKLPEASHTRGL